MTLSEYYFFRLEQVTDGMYEKYMPQKGNNGERFIYTSYPSLNDFIRSYVEEINDIDVIREIVSELEEDGELIEDKNSANTLIECIQQINKDYSTILNARLRFEIIQELKVIGCEIHDIDEIRDIFSKLEDDGKFINEV